MADVTTTIGSGQDYADIATWEADLDNSGVYSSGDVAYGECQNEVYAGVNNRNVTINGGTTVGLASVRLRGAVGQRHDGTAGTGARLVMNGSGFGIAIARANCTVSWLEIDMNGQGGGSGCQINGVSSTGNTEIFANMVTHGGVFTDATNTLYRQTTNNRSGTFLNCVGYHATWNHASGASAAGILNNDADGLTLNCTIHDLERTDGFSTGELYGIHSNSFAAAKNCLATSIVDTAGTLMEVLCFKYSRADGADDFNASSDASSDDESGTNCLINITAANQYVSTTVGSEDLHLKTGADCIGEGTDLGTTPTGVQFDIDGFDRDTEAVVWDIGADQFVAAGGGFVAAWAARANILLMPGAVH